MLPLIFVLFVRRCFGACAHSFWEFSQNFASQTKALFVFEIRWRLKKILMENEQFLCPKTGKKKDFTQNLSMFVLVKFIVAILWSKNISVQEYKMFERSKFLHVRSR